MDLLLASSEDPLQQFQDKLSNCLLAIFCPVEGRPSVPSRFWDHLSICLHFLLLNGAYPLFNRKMQVHMYSWLSAGTCCELCIPVL